MNLDNENLEIQKGAERVEATMLTPGKLQLGS